MDPKYQPMFDQAVQLQRQVHDAADPNHPMSNVLRHETQSLVNDIKENKNPRDIESRTKIIQQQLVQAQAQGEGVMNAERIDYFRDNYQRMQMDMRRFDNY